jgi:hypothetical protein
MARVILRGGGGIYPKVNAGHGVVLEFGVIFTYKQHHIVNILKSSTKGDGVEPPHICASYDAIIAPNHLHTISGRSTHLLDNSLETTRTVTNHHLNHWNIVRALSYGYVQHAICTFCQHVSDHWTTGISNTTLASGIALWHHRHKDAE